MNTDQKIANLMTVARRSEDAESLWQIASVLERLSAWQEARDVERKAEEVERHLAEQAAK